MSRTSGAGLDSLIIIFTNPLLVSYLSAKIPMIEAWINKYRPTPSQVELATLDLVPGITTLPKSDLIFFSNLNSDNLLRTTACGDNPTS